MARRHMVSAMATIALLVCAAGGQVFVGPAGAPAEDSADGPKVVPLVKTDFDVATWLDKARERIEGKEYSRAIEILQAIIEGDSGFVSVDKTGQQFVAMRVEATRLIGTMGPEGLQQYRQLYNTRAERKLADAIQAGSVRGMENVAATYLHTPAGQQALERLGAIHFDRGRFLQAARYWRRGLEMAEASPRPLLMAKVAAALQLGGRTDDAAQLAAELAETYPDAAAQLGGREQKLTAFTEAFLQRKPIGGGGVRRLAGVYPGWGGVPDGLAIMDDGEFVLLPQWQTATVETDANVLDMLLARDVVENMRTRRGQQISDQVELRDGHITVPKDSNNRSRNQQNLLYLPPVIQPVVTDRWVIYRTDARVIAVDRETGLLAWDTWQMLPLERQPEETGNNNNRQVFYHGRTGLFVDRGWYGLTVGGGYVYTIWDFPYDDPNTRGAVSTAEAKVSSLTALRLDMEGYAAWTVGHSGTDDALKSVMFISLPTYVSDGPDSGRLYVMGMEMESYYLLCLDPHNRGKLVWKTEVAQTPAMQTRGAYAQFAGLTMIGTPPAVADGRVFVTTNAGVVAAFDAETGKGVWAYQYQADANPNAMRAQAISLMTEPTSRINPILISGGIVVAQPSDAPSLIALNADDGSPAWKESPRTEGLDHLAALDAEQFLLSGEGVKIYRFRDGKELASLSSVKPTVGRPAVTPESILLSGEGLIYRISTDDFNVDRMQLAEAYGLLGNLVSADGQLFAANMLGVSCYSRYDLANSRLTERIAKADPLRRAELLFKRGHLAFVSGQFDQALQDFEACRKTADAIDDEQQRHSFLTQLRPRLYRAYVALGNAADDREVRLARFEQAAELADSPSETLHMKVRMFKHYEDVGQFERSIRIARQIRSDFGEVRLADVKIGRAADMTVTIASEATTHFGKQWANDNIERLIRVHGQGIYAPFDAAAERLLQQATANGDATALQQLAEEYPHSTHVADARFLAAELYYRKALRRHGQEAAEALAKARSCLMSVWATTEKGSARQASTVIGLAAVDMARGVPQSARSNLGTISETPRDITVAFADFQGPLGEVIEKIVNSDTPPVPLETSAVLLPHLPDSLRRLMAVEDRNATIVTDSELRPITLDGMVFVLREKTLEFWQLDHIVPDKTYEPRSVDVDLQVQMNRVRLQVSGMAWAAGLSKDRKRLWLADRTHALGIDIAKAEVVHRVAMKSLRLNGRAVSVAMGEGLMAAMDMQGNIGVMDLTDGSLKWTSKVKVRAPAMAAASRFVIGPGCVVLLADAERTAYAFDVASGKLILDEAGEQRAGAMFTPDGKLVLVIDDEITLRQPTADAIKQPLAGRVLENDSVAILLAVSNNYAVVAPSQDRPQLLLLGLDDLADGTPVALDPQPLADGDSLHPVGAIIDDRTVYVFSSLEAVTSPVLVSRPTMAKGLVLTRFDMPGGKIRWQRQAEINAQEAGRFIAPTNTARHILAGVMGVGLREKGAWMVFSKADSTDKPNPVDLVINVAQEVPRTPAATKRLQELGAAAVAGGRLIVETFNGLEVYGDE